MKHIGFIDSVQQQCKRYAGFIDRATETVNKNIGIICRATEIVKKTSPGQPGNQAGATDSGSVAATLVLGENMRTLQLLLRRHAV